MRFQIVTQIIFFSLAFQVTLAQQVHVWEMHELTFIAENKYKNPYLEATVWVDLKGPGFEKRVFGFWDGSDTFRVRVTAIAPGEWHWKSGSQPADPGFTEKQGTFTTLPWSEDQKKENPLRRGFIRSTPNKHALMFADGTPYFAVGDTWFPLGTDRFRWLDDDQEQPMGPGAGFKDYVRYRKAQGYNWVSFVAAYPNWKTDDKPWQMLLEDSARTTLRSAWMEYGSNGSAKNMDNEGGRPFLFPGKVPGYENYFPDLDKINPAYFKFIDRKIAYLNEHGFIPFLEIARRDIGPLWFRHYQWPDSYARYIGYMYARYQAYNTVLSPIHLDIIRETITPGHWAEAIVAAEKKYGLPPFGNLLSANAHPSTLENWGDSSWVTLHQIGNVREHVNYWYLTEVFYSKYPLPVLNGEPYYAGYTDSRGSKAHTYDRGAKGGTADDNAFVRSCMYGSFLSGGLAGHVYGAEGIWGGDIEPAAPVHLWEAMQWKSGAEMRHLKTFAFSIGTRYQNLEPLPDLVYPNKTRDILSYEGWAYCARTPDKNFFLTYFEKGCAQAKIRGAKLNAFYDAQWFDPRNGTWQDVEGGKLAADNTGIIQLPELPDELDWGLKLVYTGPNDAGLIAPTVIAGEQSLLNKVHEAVAPDVKAALIKKVLLYASVALLIVGAIILYDIKRRRKKRGIDS